MVYLDESLRRSENKLIRMIKEKRWLEIIEKLRCGVFGSMESNEQDRSTLKYPLHFVSSAFDAPQEQLSCLISLLLKVKLSITEAQDKNGYTPLHLACVFGLDIKCIRALIEANPLSCTLLTKKGDTPLSLACQRSTTSYETISLLLKHFSNALSLKNNMGWLPLHCAVWHNLPSPSLVTIIQSFPDAIYCRTYSSEHTPLSLYWSGHSACILSQEEWDTISLLSSPCHYSSQHLESEIASSEVGLLHRILSFPQYLQGLIQAVLLTFPDEAMIEDKFGRLPLHRLIEHDQFQVNDIQEVSSAYPQAAGIIDPLTGDFPLASAISCRARRFKWQEVPQEIFHRFPDAIYYCSKRNKLHPFMLAATYSSLDICFELLRSAPELVYP